MTQEQLELYAARWQAFRNRDCFENIDITRFVDQFREDADAIIDAAIQRGPEIPYPKEEDE